MSNNSDQPSEIERHYTVSEIATQWHLGDNTVRRLFIDEPGVLTIGAGSRLVRGRGQKYKRRYFTLRIPRSVFLRVQERLVGKGRPTGVGPGCCRQAHPDGCRQAHPDGRKYKRRSVRKPYQPKPAAPSASPTAIPLVAFTDEEIQKRKPVERAEIALVEDRLRERINGL